MKINHKQLLLQLWQFTDYKIDKLIFYTPPLQYKPQRFKRFFPLFINTYIEKYIITRKVVVAKQ